jgi:Domain of unknown function (DUF4878)
MTQPKGMSTTKIVLIIVGSVLAVCCVGGGIAAYFGFRVFSEALGPPRATTEAFIRDLQSGDAASAYGKLCGATRAAVTQDRFTEMVSNRRPSTYEIVGVQVNNTNGRVSATVTARLTYADGFTDQHFFHLVKEDGTWKVCGNPY